jgi:hypothetical protein
MKGFGFQLWVAFVCLAAPMAQAGNEQSSVTCGSLVSERAYASAPVGRAAINRALENPNYTDRIVKLLEAIVWIGEQKKEVWELIASGLRNGVYNPSPSSGVLSGIPTSLRLEKGRAELLRVLEEQFTTPASYDTQEILSELLDRYPKVPFLPTNLNTLGEILSALTLSGARAFHEQQFHNYQHAFITFASHHWVNFDSSTQNWRNKDEIARRLVRTKFIPAQYIQMLHTYMVKFLNVALGDIWTAVKAGECDMLVFIDKHLPKFADDHLGRNQEKKLLLRNALIFSTIGERLVNGQLLKKEVVSTFNTYLMDLVKLAQSELPPPAPPTAGVTTTTAETKPAAKETPATPEAAALAKQTATSAPVSSPENSKESPSNATLKSPSAHSSRPARSHRKEKRQQAAAQRETPQSQTVQAARPTYPPLTDDMRAALLEGRRELTSDNNIPFQYAVKLTERLLGPYRTSGSSHYVFQNPYSDRHVFNFQRHGNDLFPSNGRQLRHLITKMIEIYKLDENEN